MVVYVVCVCVCFSVSMRVVLRVMGHLNVVVERVVPPRENVLNDLMICRHISGSKPTLCPLKKSLVGWLSWLEPLGPSCHEVEGSILWVL